MTAIKMYEILMVARIATLIFMGVFISSVSLPKSHAHTNVIAAFRTYALALFIWAAYLLLFGVTNMPIENKIITLAVAVSAYNITFKLIIRSYTMLLNLPNLPSQWGIALKWFAVNIVLIPSIIFYDDYRVAIFALWVVVVYSVFELLRVAYIGYNRYREVVVNSGECISDDIEPFIKWMKNIAIAISIWYLIGLFVSLMPVWFVTIYGVVGVLVHLIMAITFFNYLLEVQPINIVTSLINDIEQRKEASRSLTLSSLSSLEEPINDWIAAKGFLEPMTNVESLATRLNSNRAYLSTYINTKYKMSFRNWIASMRIEYAKSIMLEENLSISDVAERIHYTQSSFSTIFKKHCGESIGQWRKRSQIG